MPRVWQIAFISALPIMIGSAMLAQSPSQETNYQQTLKHDLASVEMLTDDDTKAAMANLEMGLSLTRMGQYHEAERYLRRAIRLDVATVRGQKVARPSNAEIEHLQQAVLAKDSSAVFCGGVISQLAGDLEAAELTLTYYRLVLGGDRDAAMLQGIDSKRALRRADARAESGEWAAARAELAIAEAQELNPWGTLGRKAALWVGAGNWALADRALGRMLLELPADSTLYVHLPKAESNWWRRNELVLVDPKTIASAPLSKVIVLAMQGQIDLAYEAVKAIPSLRPTPEYLRGLTIDRLRDLDSFVALASKLGRVNPAKAKLNSTLDRLATALGNSRFAEAADIAATEVSAGQSDRFTPAFTVAMLAQAMMEKDRKALPQVATHLRRWATSKAQHTPALLFGLLTTTRLKQLPAWLASQDSLAPDDDLLLFRLALGAKDLPDVRLREGYQRGLIPPHWLSDNIKVEAKVPNNELPDPKLAVKFLGDGDRSFRAKEYEKAWKAYLNAGKHDPTLSGLTRASLRAALATERYEEAISYLKNLFNDSKVKSSDAARAFKFGIADFATKAELLAWRVEVKVFADAKPALWDRLLLSAALAFEGDAWADASTHFHRYRSNVKLGLSVEGIDFFIEASDLPR